MRDPLTEPKVGDVIGVKRHTRMIVSIDANRIVGYRKPSAENKWKVFYCQMKSWTNWCIGGRVIEPVGLASTPKAPTAKV